MKIRTITHATSRNIIWSSFIHYIALNNLQLQFEKNNTYNIFVCFLKIKLSIILYSVGLCTIPFIILHWSFILFNIFMHYYTWKQRQVNSWLFSINVSAQCVCVYLNLFILLTIIRSSNLTHPATFFFLILLINSFCADLLKFCWIH